MNEGSAANSGQGVTLITVADMAATAEAIGSAFRHPTTPAQSLTLRTRDGECPAFLFKPAGHGPWPAALFLMDGFGMRPNVMEMAQRLADGGYLVLLPDLFYRHGSYEPLDVRQAFAGGQMIEAVRRHLGQSPSVAMALSDAPAFIDCLRSHSDAVGGKIGVTGYCMSGGMSLAMAGSFPEDFAAAACFHGGLLVSAAEDSPHRLAPATKAQLYVGGAQTDQWCPPEMVAELDRVLTANGVDHRCDIYEGTLHGWTMRDSPVYNERAAEWHWHELFKLLSCTLAQARLPI